MIDGSLFWWVCSLTHNECALSEHNTLRCKFADKFVHRKKKHHGEKDVCLHQTTQTFCKLASRFVLNIFRPHIIF